ncbi:MAG: ion transporter [Pirellulaceae bacterium]|nr:ion transporter [Pirellulaceae bacterium]
MVDLCYQITRSQWFGRFIISLIAISGLLAGLETYPQWSEGTSAGAVLQIGQNIILTVFVIEIAMKIIACGSSPWKFFQEPWNLFDFIIVVICLLPIDMHSASVVRMARILRAMRMITVLPRLRLLVAALLKSIPSLGYIGVLLGLHFYIYSVIGTITFGKNDPLRFGTLHSTAGTLFQVLTLEGWNDVRDTQMLGSDVTYDDAWKVLSEGQRVSEAQPVATTIYFMSFILLGTMIMLNLFTGVIISSMEEAQQEDHANRNEQLSQRGFLTMHDELRLVSSQLQELAGQMAKLQERAAALNLPSSPPPPDSPQDLKESY